MRKPGFWQTCILAFVIFIIAFGAASQDAFARTRKKHARHVKKQHHALPVEKGDIYADIVIEARTGRILHATNANSPRHPASLTKMMTLYITFQALETGNLSLEQHLSVSQHAAAQSPSKLGLRPGQTIRVHDAIMGIVTESANDAAVVLAEALGGSEERFAQMMTRQAHSLGMNQTFFQNASGLPDPDQVSSAHDMAILGHALIYHYPKFYNVFSNETFVYAGRVHHNHNHLMERYDGMDGIKTGYVRASGFNLVASAARGDRRLIGVVFGGRSTMSRDNQMAQLLDQGFASEPAGTQTVQTEEGNEAQGDSSDVADNHYVALPSKVSMAFASANAEKNVTVNDPQGGIKKISALPSNWGIQVGAFNDSASGQQMLSKLTQDMKPLLSKADPILQKIQTNDGATIYRARFMGMEQASARSICSYIIKRGQNCVVVAPEQTNGL